MNSLISQIIFFLLTVVGLSILGGVMTTNFDKKINALSNRLSAVEAEENSKTPTTTTPKPVILFSSKLSSNLDFFGDSITQGFRVGGTERWSALVSTFLGKVENNFGNGGDQWLDAAVKLYNSHTPGNSAFFNYGINDIARGQRKFDEMKRCIYAYVLYCSLPAANIVNARNATLSANGWENTGAYNTIGVMTAAANGGTFANTPTITATVQGRYIGFASTVVNTSDVNNNWALTINIDTKNIEDTPTPFFNSQTTSTNGASFAPSLWIYDTGDTSAAQSHTIVLTPSVNNNYTDRAFVDYFFGFDAGVKGASAVTLLQPTHFNFVRYDPGISQPPDGPTALAAYNTMLRDVVRDMSNVYGLPVMLVSDTLPLDSGYTSFDLVHPLQRGHRYIAKRVTDTLSQPITTS